MEENEISGQVHVWRLIANVIPGSNSSGSVKATFTNPDSGFEVNSIQLATKWIERFGKYSYLLFLYHCRSCQS
jgi:hypothetical protein